MLHAAAHNIMLSGNMDFWEPIQIKRETIRLVNKRLADPIQSIRDVTIGAVACLVLLEVSGKVTP